MLCGEVSLIHSPLHILRQIRSARLHILPCIVRVSLQCAFCAKCSIALRSDFCPSCRELVFRVICQIADTLFHSAPARIKACTGIIEHLLGASAGICPCFTQCLVSTICQILNATAALLPAADHRVTDGIHCLSAAIRKGLIYGI